MNKFKKDFKDVKTSLDRCISFLNRDYEIDKDEIPKELAEEKEIQKGVTD